MDMHNKLNLFNIISIIGKGTFGTVFLCQNKIDNHLIVLKEVLVNSPHDQQFKDTQNEIKVLSSLRHPFVITYYDSFYINSCIYISMEYATHGNLAEYMLQKNKFLLPQCEILHFFCQILLGIQHIHSNDIIHRDIKAENILLSGQFGHTVKIGDFGIARFLRNEMAVTLIGTPYYLAPELCESKPYDAKTDIWALGCLLYEMCTHSRAFDSDNLAGLINQIISGNVTPINKEQYEPQLQDLIDNMLTVVPEKRCSVSDLMNKSILIPTLYQFSPDSPFL